MFTVGRPSGRRSNRTILAPGGGLKAKSALSSVSSIVIRRNSWPRTRAAAKVLLGHRDPELVVDGNPAADAGQPVDADRR